MDKVTQQKIERWQRSMAVITSDVQGLLHSRQHIVTLESICNSNDYVKHNIGTFWTYYKINYLFFAVSKICQQIDEDKRSQSLINLLKDLLNSNQLITKRWWTQGNSVFNGIFEKRFGAGDYLDATIVCSDIQELKNATNEVKKLRNKRVAHKKKGDKVKSSISGNTLNGAIDKIEQLVLKYQALLTGGGAESLVAELDNSWSTIFTRTEDGK